jgi:hypothetical protein
MGAEFRGYNRTDLSELRGVLDQAVKLLDGSTRDLLWWSGRDLGAWDWAIRRYGIPSIAPALKTVHDAGNGVPAIRDQFVRMWSIVDALIKLIDALAERNWDSNQDMGPLLDRFLAGRGFTILASRVYQYTQGARRADQVELAVQKAVGQAQHRYIVGPADPPEIHFIEQYPYDPKAEPTAADYRNWAWWGLKLQLAYQARPDLKDALPLYNHYRGATGTDMSFDYAKAYRDDAGVRTIVDGEVASARKEAERLIRAGAGNDFHISGVPSPSGNYDAGPETENWQKAIGDHVVWGDAQVSVRGNQVTMRITVHAQDRWNFNPDAKDIATGTDDAVNGRFGQLGWARPFNTHGSLQRTVTWTIDR